MTSTQRLIKYAALFLAALLILAMILGIYRLGRLLFRDDGVAEMPFAIEITESFTALDIELRSTSLTVLSGDVFSLETNNRYIRADVSDGELQIREERRLFFGDREDSELILTLPKELVLDSVELLSGAGIVRIDALNAREASLFFGAGEVDIRSLYTTERTEIEGGAGRITLGGMMHDLDLDMGVGELVLTAVLTGKENSVDCGVGSAEITLLEDASDYTVSLSKGLGSIYVNGREIPDANKTIGNGERLLSISGGVGELRIMLPQECAY